MKRNFDLFGTVLVQAGNSLYAFICVSLIVYEGGVSYVGDAALSIAHMSICAAVIALGIPETIQKSIGKNHNEQVSLPIYGMLFIGLIYFVFLIFYFNGKNESFVASSVIVLCSFLMVLNESSARLCIQNKKYFLGQGVTSFPQFLMWTGLLYNFLGKQGFHPFFVILGSWLVVLFVSSRIFSLYFFRGSYVFSLFPPTFGYGSAAARVSISIFEAMFVLMVGEKNSNIAGFISYIYRLFGPVSMFFSVVTSRVQQAQFSGVLTSGFLIKMSARNKLYINLLIGVLLTVVVWILADQGDLQMKMMWYLFVFFVCIHRSMYISFQYISQVGLDFIKPRIYFLVLFFLLIFCLLGLSFFNNISIVLLASLVCFFSILITLFMLESIGKSNVT